MGRVFRAEVVAPAPGLEPGSTVALKLVHAYLLEKPGYVERFRREAELGRTIEHENVVRTYDSDAQLLNGVQQNFLVMEYVEGQSLRDLHEELERVPEELCRPVGREVAKGLVAIHEAGVVHRDLKSENVLITPEHLVKIMDLGVAHLQDERIRMTRAEMFAGSVEYAAPEQFHGGRVPPDGRSDLFSLGVVLYELATGTHPFRTEAPRAIFRRILDEEPRKAGELNPQISPFFEEVLSTLLEKDPEARFPSSAELLQVLEGGESGAWWSQRTLELRLSRRRPLRRIQVPQRVGN